MIVVYFPCQDEEQSSESDGEDSSSQNKPTGVVSGSQSSNPQLADQSTDRGGQMGDTQN